VACFSGPKSDRQTTTIHHASTTNSPSKNHIQTPVFRKNHRKNEQNHPNKKNHHPAITAAKASTIPKS